MKPGVKHSMAGGRVTANTAVFYTDYRDLQVQSFIRFGVPDITNAAAAVIRGVEVEVGGRRCGLACDCRATSRGWTPHTIVSSLLPGGATRPVEGNRLNNAPEWSGAGSAVYEFPTRRAGTASLRADLSWQSQVFFTPVNDAIETQRAYGLVHLRAAFEPTEPSMGDGPLRAQHGQPGIHRRHGERCGDGVHRSAR